MTASPAADPPPVLRPGQEAVVALVPLRAPGEGKSRLAGTLSVDGRAALAGAMLADVVAALREGGLERIVVAAGGAAAVAAASALGLETVRDPAGVRDLDAAVAAASARIGAVAATLVVAADLPRLRGVDVATLVATDAEVAVAPTVDGGTGGLLRRPPEACPTAYGAGSARRHLAAARRAGRRAARCELAGFAHDVDVAADLAHVPGLPVGPRTASVLRELDVADAS